MVCSRAAPFTRAIYLTCAYADIFDYPLTLTELHRRLIGLPISLADLKSHLRIGNGFNKNLHVQDGLIALAGREEIIPRRKHRSAYAGELWPTATRYGKIIARLPFVRMLAVTGALAVDNVERGTDLDYLIVTEPGYLWICRAWSIALVRLAAQQGVALCPNYFISEQALVFKEQNLYTAHELIQMVPIFGQPIYETIRRVNSWSHFFLPNAAGPPAGNVFAQSGEYTMKDWIEKPFRNSLGNQLERWEMNRKIRKFTRINGSEGESAFSANWCKGHFDHHGKSTMSALETRLHLLNTVLR